MPSNQFSLWGRINYNRPRQQSNEALIFQSKRWIICWLNLYTYKSLVILLAWLIVWLLEAVRRFGNSRVQSTCYESWSNNSSASDSTFKVKMTQCFLSVHWEKNWVILACKFGSKFCSTSNSTFLVKLLFCQRLNLFGQNDSFFLSVHEGKKIE